MVYRKGQFRTGQFSPVLVYLGSSPSISGDTAGVAGLEREGGIHTLNTRLRKARLMPSPGMLLTP